MKQRWESSRRRQESTFLIVWMIWHRYDWISWPVFSSLPILMDYNSEQAVFLQYTPKGPFLCLVVSASRMFQQTVHSHVQRACLHTHSCAVPHTPTFIHPLMHKHAEMAHTFRSRYTITYRNWHTWLYISVHSCVKRCTQQCTDKGTH